MIVQHSVLLSILSMLIFTSTVNAQERVLYCVEKHISGMQGVVEGSPASPEDWVPSYGGEEFGRRFTIRFNESMTEMSGVHGTATKYYCERFFPTKSPDVITCVNSLVRTMTFNFSTENEHFLLNITTPGGWLGIDTKRDEGEAALADQLVFGECQAF